jgi:2-methylcitrate dehydratase PrpD
MPGGARVPGTSLELDPVQGAFVNTLLTAWECAPAGARGHPCQHIGALLAVADAQARQALMQAQTPLTVRELEGALLTSHEIQQGLAAMKPPLHGRGDPTLLLCIAQTAVLSVLMGASPAQTTDAMTQALLDGVALPPPRKAAETGTRAADAASRAVRLSLWTLAGEAGCPDALQTPRWGFCEVVLGGRQPTAVPAFEARLPEQPGGPAEALQQLVAAAQQAFRPAQLERVQALLAGPPASLDAHPVSALMAHLVTHAARDASRQMTLLE